MGVSKPEAAYLNLREVLLSRYVRAAVNRRLLHRRRTILPQLSAGYAQLAGPAAPFWGRGPNTKLGCSDDFLARRRRTREVHERRKRMMRGDRARDGAQIDRGARVSFFEATALPQSAK